MTQRGRSTRRVWLPALLFGLFAVAICGRLVQLQVIEPARYQAEANDELTASTTIYARRGSILDRNGSVLATSVDTWDVYANTGIWKDPAKALAISTKIAPAIGTDAAALRSLVAQSSAVDLLVG